MATNRAETRGRSGRAARAGSAYRAGSGGRSTAEEASDRAEPFTYVQRGTTIVGELEATGRVRVHGVVKGNVRVDGPLEVAEAGVVEGASVEAAEVKIIGRMIVERLVVSGKVEIWRGGELIGDVRAAALDIEEGALFTGRSEMVTSQGTPFEADAPGHGAALHGAHDTASEAAAALLPAVELDRPT